MLLCNWWFCALHVLTNLDDILGIHSLDKIRETAEEAISCSSLEREKRKVERQWGLYNTKTICADAALVVHKWPIVIHAYATISYSFQTEASPQLIDRLIHFICVRHQLRVPGSQRKSTVSAPRVINLVPQQRCTQVNTISTHIVCHKYLNSLTQILFFRLW